MRVVGTRGFLALSVSPRHLPCIERRLAAALALTPFSLEAGLIRHMRTVADALGADWNVVVAADAAPAGSANRRRLDQLVRRAVPGLEREIANAHQPLLLTRPGLLARYRQLDALADVQEACQRGEAPAARLLCIAADETVNMPVIDGRAPAGGSSPPPGRGRAARGSSARRIPSLPRSCIRRCRDGCRRQPQTGGIAMIDRKSLLFDLRRQLKRLEQDLAERGGIRSGDGRRARSGVPGPRGEAERTGDTFRVWCGGALTQAAVAWLLGCVFVRFAEDNALIETALIAGPGERNARTADRQTLYFRAHPTDSDRDYLLDVFAEVESLPGNGARSTTASTTRCGATASPATRRATCWRSGARWTRIRARSATTSPTPNGTPASSATCTRTSPTTEEALRPAANPGVRRGVHPGPHPHPRARRVRPSPASASSTPPAAPATSCSAPSRGCGGSGSAASRAPPSGCWSSAPWTESTAWTSTRSRRSIARFRLLVAALRAARVQRIKEAPNFRIHVAAGDSLLHGRRFGFDELDLGSEAEQLIGRKEFGHAFLAEDLDALSRILGQRYHVVVGNPPYVTVKDKAANRLYRARYSTCHRQYSLAVPFTERFFGLALPGGGPERAGYVGLITANSFMKREFGKRLIESFLPSMDLTHVIDTSGAYIPGHGTPTVILLGRHRASVGDAVRTVMGVRGEPSTPRDPSRGQVWSAIVEQSGRCEQRKRLGEHREDLARGTFSVHPWSIGGGGAKRSQRASRRAR